MILMRLRIRSDLTNENESNITVSHALVSVALKRPPSDFVCLMCLVFIECFFKWPKVTLGRRKNTVFEFRYIFKRLELGLLIYKQSYNVMKEIVYTGKYPSDQR